MVKMSVDLLCLPVSLEEPPQNTHPLDPETLLAGTGILGTLPLTKTWIENLLHIQIKPKKFIHEARKNPTCVPSFPPGSVILPDPGSEVDSDRLLDHETILDQLANILPGIGVGNLVDFVGVQPNLVLAALHHAGGKPLLELKGTHSGVLLQF